MTSSKRPKRPGGTLAGDGSGPLLRKATICARGGNDVDKMLALGNAPTAVIVLEGKWAGGRNPRLSKRRVTVELRPFRKLAAVREEALAAQVERLGALLGREGVTA